jgi:hypothetical protein
MHSKAFRIFCFLILLSIPQHTNGQGIQGRLTDLQNNPVPFAAVYDETTFTGTTSNADGYYELKLQPGQHSILFRALGYRPVHRIVTAGGESEIINISLTEQVYEIKEVVVRAKKEDPAYTIMRRVIGLAPFHLNQVREYTAEVYLRGTVQILHIPKIITRYADEDIRDGDTFLEESFNGIHFYAPDKYEQNVKSYRSTSPEDNDNVNPMDFINASFYQPVITEFISPLAPNAFSYYTYRYEGFFEEGTKTIFKIGVTPKRNSQQLMKGNLYIVDKLWCLHSAEASVQMFFGTLNYSTLFSPLKGNAWLPISYRFDVDASILGIKLAYRYTSAVKYQEVVLNENIPGKFTGTAVPILAEDTTESGSSGLKNRRDNQALETLLGKEELTNRDMMKMARLVAGKTSNDTADSRSLEIREENQNVVTVEKDAIKKDTAYWNTVRPIPLTAMEANIPVKGDSILAESLDTLSAKGRNSGKDTSTTGKLHSILHKTGSFIIHGAGFRLFNKTLQVHYDGLIGLKKFDFNTVDGFIYRQFFRFEQKIDSAHRVRIDPGLAYAFSRHRFMWWTDVYYEYLPMRGGNIRFHIGSESADYNQETGMNSTINSLASLFFRRNYLKLYQLNQVFITNRIDLANGLNLTATAGYHTAQPLSNQTRYSFFYGSTREYTANVPADDTISLTRNIYNREAFWDATLEYTPRNYYRVRNGSKHYEYSKYPTFFLRNRMAMPGIIGSTADYDLLEIGARQRVEWAMNHAFSWSLKGGFFLGTANIFLTDDKYFKNYSLPVTLENTGNAFMQAPFYRNATTRKYAELHLTFSTPYLLIKYLPFLSNKMWLENLHLNYLVTGQVNNYWEAGYSISKIYLAGNVGVYAGFNDVSFQSVGVQVGIEL